MNRRDVRQLLRFAAAPVIEALEPRRCFSVTLHEDGLLEVVGTKFDDSIGVGFARDPGVRRGGG
jgi:hypothetical protein